MANKIRIKDTRWPQGRTIGGGTPAETRVYEINADDPMPPNAVVVDKDAELHDWREEK